MNILLTLPIFTQTGTDNIWLIIAYAAIAGIIGTTTGGIIALFVKKDNSNIIGLGLTFSAAVLLTLAFADFIPHAIEDATSDSVHGIWLVLAGLMVGFVLVWALRFAKQKKAEKTQGQVIQADMPKITKDNLSTSAILIVIAIIIHDFPKGMTLGMTGSLAFALAVAMAHIPEGIAIGLPFKASGAKPWKTLLGCFLAGIALMVGAIIGYFIGGYSELLNGAMFALAAGTTIGVVVLDILPSGYERVKSSKWFGFAFLIGILLVLLLDFFL